jgi:hypothetical protein
LCTGAFGSRFVGGLRPATTDRRHKPGARNLSDSCVDGVVDTFCPRMRPWPSRQIGVLACTMGAEK